MASLKPQQSDSDIPSNSNLSDSSKPANITSNEQNDDNTLQHENHITDKASTNDDKESSLHTNDTPTKSVSSPNDVFSSIRNTANKIARSGSRKLRNFSEKTSQITRSKPNEKNASSSALHLTPPRTVPPPPPPSTDENAKRKPAKIRLKQMFHRQKSKSNPSSPVQTEKEPKFIDTSQFIKSDIVIGATYSHSDNEMIDNKLKSIRRKKSRTKFLNQQSAKRNTKNGLFTKTAKDDDVKPSGDIGMRLDDKDREYDAGIDADEDEKDEKTSNVIVFQFLKNMKNIDTTRMNTIISQSSQSINNYIQKQRTKVINSTIGTKISSKDIHKSSSYLKGIPQKSLELWKKQQEYELNRFAKMSSQATYKPFHSVEKQDYFENSECILWEQRIMTDIIRAGKLFVCGEVNEIFEFPSFKSTHEKEELVRTTIRYLESAVQEAITSLLTINGVNHKQKDKKLNKDAAKEISVKCVRQSLISLCQEFVNDPYFKYLKESCEDYNMQPTDIGLIGNQDVKSIKSWTPRLCINITGNRIYTHIVRVFQCYKLNGIEAMETQIYFGFKRTYSIDCMGGPPWILPPIFLAHDKEKQIAYQISIPKEKALDFMQLDMHVPDATDFIPTLQ